MSPYSRRTGKRYAAGSQKTRGGWESVHCAACGARIVLSRGHAIYCLNPSGEPFSLCEGHVGLYARFYTKAAA